MDNTMPTYEGILEPWKVDLIACRAKRMGFGKHDLPDLTQRLAMVLGRFTYDPSKANGAKESTAVQALVDRYLRFVHRTADRYREHVEFASLRSEPTCHADDEYLAIDVRQSVAALSERDQVVCRGLAAGRSKAEIARELRCGWYTVERAIRRIAVRFEELELDGWLVR